MNRIDPSTPVLVIGAGIMGAGIAQIAAQAGHAVMLFDAREGAAAQAQAKLAATLEGLAAKGRLEPGEAAAAAARIRPVASLAEAREVGLVVEAIVENLDAKRALFRQLEDIVPEGCVLASNTSSISITALANGLRHPGRLVGMHFFNPVPLMKLVEVVSGLHTEGEVAEAIFHLAMAWGKTPVHARSTPGFIVNRIARPYYAETLALLLERAAEPRAIDACLRAAGFRMGPCELMDLIGHDTNFAVTESVWQANFGDKRYAPSLVQRELVDGGLLGRKSGRGFYDYREGAAAAAPAPAAAATADGPPESALLQLHGSDPVAEGLAQALAAAGVAFTRQSDSGWTGLQADEAQLRLSDGRPAAQLSAETGVQDLAVFDLPIAGFAGAGAGAALAWAPAAGASEAWQRDAARWLRVAGFAPQRMRDAAGLVVARTIAMLVNESADAVLQGVCTPEGADLAMKLGVNYPAGPFEWLARWDASAVVQLLEHLDAHYRGERYRVSPGLRQRAWTGAAA
ncbi:3-hydroxyacyl-CoA dehydrogenase [Caldimonas tepidiphila]|uniref:3-hydroxyacyl-CoA dehydrogenase n=1 Tax=Caldimonas tepidiphila TaxID=2315841 RepID=UPI000E5A954C|nr:3-hydroxyacyl-CoA dehydrogenase [Caldimonas tepidiphila]